MSRKFWTEDELTVLRELYPYMRSNDIAARMGCTRNQVLGKAWKIGLKKTREAIASMARAEMDDPQHPGRQHQFKKGAEPWNKGIPFEPGGRSAETRFKKGHAPVNWLPIGSERERTDGYLERKLTDTGVTRRDFVCVHRIVWQEAGREIPPGQVLIFKDGNKRNFALDNLELVTRADLMRRNSAHNYGPEIFKLHQLQGAITRQINKRQGKSK